jgi:hypothetical protein
MANAYDQTISGEVATTLGGNTRKTKHVTFNYGTPRIYPLVIIRTDEGDWTSHADSDSDFHKVINYLQGRGVEIYGIGDVAGTNVSIFVNWEKTPKDDVADEQEPNSDDFLDLFGTEISTLLSISVRIEYGKIEGGALANDC